MHAFLAPSASHRWLECTRAPHFEKKFPSKTSDFADEGTLAHAIGALLVNQRIGKRLSLRQFELALLQFRKNKFFSNDMMEYCEQYCDYVQKIYEDEKAKGPVTILIEQEVRLKGFIPDPTGEGFGTIDIQICSPRKLNIIDLKYGKGVKVSAVRNSQLMIYSIGSYLEFDLTYCPVEIEYHIYQPRIDNIDRWKLGYAELSNWAHTVLIPRAKMAYENKGEFRAGEHCQFCAGKAKCKALSMHNMELAKYEFQLPDELADDEIVEIFLKAEVFVNWINSVKDYALDQALNHKKQWDGLKVVEGRSNRKWRDEKAVYSALGRAGYMPPQFLKQELLGFGDMEKLLGKQQLERLLGKHIIKQPGKPALVPASDKRASKFGAEGAKNDFKDIL